MCTAHDVTTQLKGTLRQYPGCIHWHLRILRHKGTLEATLWPKSPRLWLNVADNRRAAWIDDAVPVLKAEIESRLSAESLLHRKITLSTATIAEPMLLDGRQPPVSD